jgi:antitoxin CptB
MACCNLGSFIQPSSSAVSGRHVDYLQGPHAATTQETPYHSRGPWRGATARLISAASMDGVRVNRIRYRAWRRGFREADLILGPFADSHAPSMTSSELDRFEALLDQPDHDIYAWFLGSLPVPPAFDDDLMARLRAFRPGEATSPRAGQT